MKGFLFLFTTLAVSSLFAQAEESEGMRSMRLSCEKHKVALGCFNYANMLLRREQDGAETFFEKGCKLKHEPSCQQEKWDLPPVEKVVAAPVEIEAPTPIETIPDEVPVLENSNTVPSSNFSEDSLPEEQVDSSTSSPESAKKEVIEKMKGQEEAMEDRASQPQAPESNVNVIPSTPAPMPEEPASKEAKKAPDPNASITNSAYIVPNQEKPYTDSYQSDASPTPKPESFGKAMGIVPATKEAFSAPAVETYIIPPTN